MDSKVFLTPTVSSIPQGPQILVKYEDQQQNIQKENDSLSIEGLQQGRWSEADNLRFTAFIDKNKVIFNSRHQRKSMKIFKHFSDYIGNRSPSQCRSHYQKLLLKHKTIPRLKRYYRDYFGEQMYHQELQRLEFQIVNGPQKAQEDNRRIFTTFGTQTDQIIDRKENTNQNGQSSEQSLYFYMPIFNQQQGLSYYIFQKKIQSAICLCKDSYSS